MNASASRSFPVVLTALFAVASSCLAAPTLFQVNPTSLPVQNPWTIAVGDFNRDGVPDMAVSSYTDFSVVVLLGDGIGGFTAAPGSPIKVGFTPRQVTAGDFNGDGSPDLAVASEGGSILILLGNGSGGFVSGATFSFGASFYIGVGKINADAALDLALVNNPKGYVATLFGDGSGQFTATPGSPVTVGINPNAVAIGDYNADGLSDLAVINYGDGFGSSISVFLGNGSGVFTQAAGSPFSTGDGAMGLALGDFNGDGAPDLAAACSDSNTVSIHLGLGGGKFTMASPVAVGSSPRSIGVADFNADGIADLAVANSGDGTVSLLLGTGRGGFVSADGSPYVVGSGPNCVSVGDFNGDGSPDLAVANRSSDTVSILLNQFIHADLMVSLGVDKIDVKQGSTLTYTVTVQNFGPNRAANVEVDNTLSSSATFVSAKASKGRFTAPLVGQTGTVIWNLGNMAADEVQGAQLAVTVIAKAKATITNKALVFSDTIDPKMGNNSASISVNVVSGGSGSNGGKK